MITLHHRQYQISVALDDGHDALSSMCHTAYQFGDDPMAHLRVICQPASGAATCCTLPCEGGGAIVTDYSMRVWDDVLYLAAGNSIIALDLPTLHLRWRTVVDVAMCFGVYYAEKHQCLISHGECEIVQVLKNGKIVWRFSGKDIFTGGCTLDEGHVRVTDFNNEYYEIDMITGTGHLIR